MILPGHIAASILCHRYLKIDLRMALAAGVIPDLVDKLAYYGLHVVSGSRLPMHTLAVWVASTALVALLACLWHAFPARVRSWTERHSSPAAHEQRLGAAALRWSVAWGVGYAAHLLCDLPFQGGKLPFLYPFRTYTPSGPRVPLSFLFGLDAWPLPMLLGEFLLVLLALYTEWQARKGIDHPLPVTTLGRRPWCRPGSLHGDGRL